VADAWIRMVEETEATDFVKTAYDGFIKQRGWVPHIMKVHSLRPNTLRAIMQLVNAVMYDPSSGLSRAQREMIATVVSATNRCTY
jgi:uncharacterized peroxidase-related enzyme